ncbi:LANO_0F00826g1_1 [Lachancea nothofagi CBS 11611]|uniref:Restriction of telomere capping protein 1 n=1 Tax=Lachancea nothofagi CBS 11611 TaxID=1266666 RepID=A0A1G4K5M4_9SACH|nr:LANO_0F00826g1_1 [Lachancea nothofagi CBS 11611]
MSRSRSPSVNETSITTGSRLPSPLSRFSLHKPFQQLSGSGGSFHGTSPKTKTQPRYPIGGFPPSMDSLKEYDSSGSGSASTKNWKSYVNPGQIKSTGLKYSLQVSKELSSIDKINDPQRKAVMIAGKNHLGLYDFQNDSKELRCVHDFLSNSKKTSTTIRGTKKISTISDVKAGFHNHKNYVAICGTSNSVSIYDINRASSAEGSLATVLSKHTRSINSVDFNMSQSSLIISGGQDGCVKVWDLRSSQGGKNKSDISINSGSDSVRDVKWMPSFDFAGYDNSTGTANGGHRFASIHDSGLLLTYDLRQPSQAEKRINAHSGPGLCLSWHPNFEYIMTGGRDGKCCLWNVGGKNQNVPVGGNAHHSNSFASSNASSLLTPGYSMNSPMIAPDVVINTAHPLTKLKFQPSSVDNVFNSVIALSSLGENSDVSLYSLSRAFIPKNILTTTTPSCGFVWWDENSIFNIDKQNIITGWDLSQEPIALDNLRKNVVSWRDIEGDGMLFFVQDKGGYELNQGSSSQANHASSQSKVSSTSVHNMLSNSALRHNSSTTSFPALSSHHGSSATFGDRPSFPRTGTSYNNKSIYNQTFGSFNSQHNQHHNSIASISSSSTTPELFTEQLSPQLVSLDLPQILNSIMSSRTKNTAKTSNLAELSALKESPVEVFKFLARELKFSYMRESLDVKNEGKSDAITPQSEVAQSDDDIDIKTHLINRFGLAEDNTWTKFIRKGIAHEKENTKTENNDTAGAKEQVEPESLRSDASLDDYLGKLETPVQPKQQTVADESNISEVKQRIEHLIELISMCDHNAETYLYVKDLGNFKTWMMMRDALLWDLKQIAEKSKLEITGPFSSVPWEDTDSAGGTLAMRKPSVASEYSSFSASEIASDTRSQSLVKNRDSFLSGTSPKAVSGSDMRARMDSSFSEEKATGSSIERETTNLKHSSLAASLDELRIRKSIDGDNDESAIEDDDDDQNIDSRSILRGSPVSHENSMPILPKTGRKISFIDNFISTLRSPRGGHYDFEAERNRTSNSLSTKKSSQLSYSSSFSGAVPKRHVDSSPKREVHSTAANDLSTSPNQRSGDFMATKNGPKYKLKAKNSKISQMLKGRRKSETAPPWDSARLIKKIFEQSVETGNVLLTITIILLFQTTFHITSTLVVKDALAEFLNLLHKYELFEIAADLLKFCPWEDILGSGTGQCTVRIYCERCKKLLVNERSKEKFTEQWQQTGNSDAMQKFGYWYCDSCCRRNTLCVICERPLKKLALCILNCGHEGHFECMQKWFMEEEMDGCPSGCSGTLI